MYGVLSANRIIMSITLSHQYATHIWHCLEHFFDYMALISKSMQQISLQTILCIATYCFGDRITSKGLWPPHLPDLNPYYFHMWGLF